MTTSFKTTSNYYLELINTFPPRPITNEAQLITTQERIDFILDKKNITQEDRDYLKVLATLVYEYEEEHEPMPVLRGIELLKALINEDNLQYHNLISIFDDESTVIKVLEKKQEITAQQIQKLSNFFHLSPSMFLASE
ncbi:MAG: transcriptional regulator [Prochloraceae cyanobacterium]|nr:transcriptional regulator [Prochloraceae cyanobacterium]